MDKISVTGPKKELETVIEKLYDLQVLDIEHYEGELDTGSPFDESEDLSELLVDIRSLISKLPKVENSEERNISIEELQEKIPEINEVIESSEEERSNIERKLSETKERLKYYRRLKGTNLKVEDLKGTKNLDVYIGKIKAERFEESLKADDYELLKGQKATVIVYKKGSEEIEDAIRKYSKEEYGLTETSYEGSVIQVISELERERDELKQELNSIKQRLEKLSKEWSAVLRNKEKF